MQTEETDVILVEEEKQFPTSLSDLLSKLDEVGADAPALVIVLTDTSETNWIKEGTENSPEPERMAFPGLYRIAPETQVAIYRADKEGKPTKMFDLVKIRFIAGCPSLDPKWQDENGYTPNLEVDNIWIVNGTDTFLREGADAAKYDYIRLYQGNVNNPHRPPTAGDEYREIVEREIAETESVEFETTVQAMNLIKDLRKKTAKGFEYDSEKLDLFTRLFALDEKDTEVEKFSALAALVQDSPQLVINSIASHKKGVFASIRMAEVLSVLLIDDTAATLTQSKTVILPFKSKMTKANQINMLTDFLITKTGSDYYRQLLADIETEQDKRLGEE